MKKIMKTAMVIATALAFQVGATGAAFAGPHHHHHNNAKGAIAAGVAVGIAGLILSEAARENRRERYRGDYASDRQCRKWAYRCDRGSNYSCDAWDRYCD